MATANTKIASMRAGGHLLGRIRRQLMSLLSPGLDLFEIENQAQLLIRQAGAIPNFAKVNNYGFATCLMVNEEVVHSKPKQRLLIAGDLVTVDVGLEWQGWQLDTADSRLVGSEDDKFISTGRQALKKAMSMATPGRRIGQVSQAMQQIIEKNGYSAVRQYCGHGIGRQLHEEPQIFCFLERPINATELIKVGMTLAIEVMMNEGGWEVAVDASGWRATTTDGSRSAQFEHTVLVTNGSPEILTS